MYTTSSVKTEHFSLCSFQSVTFQKQKIHSTKLFKILFPCIKAELRSLKSMPCKKKPSGWHFPTMRHVIIIDLTTLLK